MTRQQMTNPDTDRWALTPQQNAAVDLVAVGTSVTEVAEAISVARQTVSEPRQRESENCPPSQGHPLRCTLPIARGSLRVASYTRPGKLFTASDDLVVGEVGVLTPEVLARIVDAVVALLRAGRSK